MSENGPVSRPDRCSYCGERRPDVRRMVTLPDGRSVDVCDRCRALARRRFGGSTGPPDEE